jgi:ABC-type lipoprotein export system ATPase subunit
MAETFINLVTGAALPDQGEVTVFGRTTASITTSGEWLAVVDRFGIVSERAVLLETLSVIQNVSVPFTLEIEPPPDDVAERAAVLARDVGLLEATWSRPVRELGASGRARVRLARALALDPAVVLLEHVSAEVPQSEARRLGVQVQAIAGRRGAATIAITADPNFAAAVAARVLTLDPASGRLTDRRRSGWFGRRLG